MRGLILFLLFLASTTAAASAEEEISADSLEAVALSTDTVDAIAAFARTQNLFTHPQLLAVPEDVKKYAFAAKEAIASLRKFFPIKH